jgi:acyl carrier protein
VGMSVRTDNSSLGHSDVLGGLAEIVRLVTGRPAADVRLDRLFVDDLRIDSLSMVEILEGSSLRFGVRIEDEAAKDFVRVRDLVDHIAERLPSV